MKKAFITSYGGAHSQGLIPVIEHLSQSQEWKVQLLGLTYGFRDFCRAGFSDVWDLNNMLKVSSPRYRELITIGEQVLPPTIDSVVGYQNSKAYYGSGFIDLQETVGAKKAAAKFSELERKSFLPVKTAEEILRFVSPDIVVTTNSPRMERAMVLGARNLGLPVIIFVPTFLSFELEWMSENEYGTRVCVFHPAVKRLLVNAGRREESISVTGNPAYTKFIQRAMLGRRSLGCKTSGINVLYLAQQELHPTGGHDVGRDPNAFCMQVVEELKALEEKQICHACVRFHPKQASKIDPKNVPISIIPNEISLADVALEFDMIVSVNSSAAIECQLVGLPVIELMWSIKAGTIPFEQIGQCKKVHSLDELGAAICHFGKRNVNTLTEIPGDEAAATIVEIMDDCARETRGE